jgi:hypothetical protein
MPKIELKTLLDLVGELKDSAQPKSASARFRWYLQENVHLAGDLRDYVEDALKESGDQFNKALQDLINHLGQCLGFDVVYGRYRGVKGEIGFDGLWQSPTAWSFVVETKTTDVYSVKTATLLGYINALVSEGKIERPDHASGVYVYGRFDAHTNQLENAITAEGRRERLRVVSVSALLNLLELKQEYGLAHRTVLGLLLPAPVRIDPLINLIADIVAQEKEEGDSEPEVEEPEIMRESVPIGKAEELTHKDGRPILYSLDEDYTGRSAVAFTFNGNRYEVHTWKEIAVTLFETLWSRNRREFEEAVLGIRGRKRPYFTRDKSELRQPELIPNTDLFFEANLSANYIVKLCYTVIEQMGFEPSILSFEAES